MIETQIHLDRNIASNIIKQMRAKNINGKTSPGKAKYQYLPVFINGTRQTERKEMTVQMFPIIIRFFNTERVFSIIIIIKQY